MTSELFGHLIHDPLPQFARVDEHIVLVHQGHVFTFARAVEAYSNAARTTRSTPNAVLTDTSLAISYRFRLETTALTRVQALGTFTEHDEVDRAWIRQWGGHPRVEHGRGRS